MSGRMFFPTLRWSAVALVVVVTLGHGCRDSPPAGESARVERPSSSTAQSEAIQAPAPVAPDTPVVSPSPPDLNAWLSKGPRVQWYGVYMMNRKVGYAEVTFRRSAPDEPGGFAQTTRVKMQVQAMGAQVSMGVDEARWYAKDVPYGLVQTTLVERTQLGETRRTARATDTGLRIERAQDGGPAQGRDAAPTQETLEAVWATTPRSLAGLRVGAESTMSVFDWQTEADTELQVTVRELKRLRRVGVETPVAVLDVRYEAMGLTSQVQVADGGVVLETSFGPGIVLRLEEREVATGGVQGLDVLGSGVPVTSALGPPGARDTLHLRVRLPEDMTLPTGPHQLATRGESGLWDVRLSSVDGGKTEPTELQDSIGPEVQMDSNHPTIQAQTAELIQGVEGRRAQVDRLVEWVYNALEKRLATHIPSASGVLAHRVGDCTEHTWLFVAMARAAGIPARPVYGLMYLGDDHRSFGYHAWAEVAVDGHWLAVDPTWNQVPVDATHLALGGRSFDVARVIGQVTIDVVE